MPGRLTSRTSPFEGDCGGANPSPAAILQCDEKWVISVEGGNGPNLTPFARIPAVFSPAHSLILKSPTAIQSPARCRRRYGRRRIRSFHLSWQCCAHWRCKKSPAIAPRRVHRLSLGALDWRPAASSTDRLL